MRLAISSKNGWRLSWLLCMALLLAPAGCRGPATGRPAGALDLQPLARWAGEGRPAVLRLEPGPGSSLAGAGWSMETDDDSAGWYAVSRERSASFRLPFCPAGGGTVGLVLRLRDPLPDAGGSAGVIVTFNGRKTARLAPGAEWADNRLELPAAWFHQGANELLLSGEPGRTAVNWLELELPGPLAHVTAGDTTRRALLSAVPLVLDLPDPLPAGAVLDLSLSDLPCRLCAGTETMGYRLEWWRDGEWTLLESIEPTDAWLDRTVSLDRLAGGPVRLRFSADGPFAAWGPLWLSWPGTGAGADAGRQQGPNLVLILADTLRADRLGAAGSVERLTPSLDGLAAESVHFLDTLAQAPSTVPSVASFISGRYFNRITSWVDRKSLPRTVPLFAEALAGQGCRTMAVMSNPLLLPETGFARGFDEYHHLPGMARRFHGRENFPVHQPAEAVNARFLERLPSLARGRFFAWLHYMDPHDPYLMGEEGGSGRRFSGGRLDDEPWEGWLGPAVEEIIHHGGSSIVPRDREMVERAYDNGVRHFDRQLGLLLAELRRRGLLENTVVAVVADHGEEFFEHGLLGHGHTVYEELLRVPALVRFPRQPGYPGPALVARRVELLDVAATLLDVMGAGPPANHAGTSLLPLLRGAGGAPESEARYFETRHRSWVKPPLNDFLVGVESGGWKLIRDRRTSEAWLYHLDTDPGETADLIGANTEQARQLRRQLKAWLGGQQPLDPEEEAPRTGEEVARREVEALKALGYMQ